MHIARIRQTNKRDECVRLMRCNKYDRVTSEIERLDMLTVLYIARRFYVIHYITACNAIAFATARD